MPSVADYFDRHLRQLLKRPLLDGYERYGMACEIRFRDLGQAWRLTIASGQLVEIRLAAAGEPPARVVFVVDEPVFWAMVTAALSPQKAFFQRRTEIKGDLYEGMKLAKLFELFFAKFPCQPSKVDAW